MNNNISIIDLDNPVFINESLLFHYTKLSTAIESIIPKRELRFNSLKNTNDPLEFLNFNHVTFTPVNYENESELRDKAKNIEKIRKYIKICSFSIDKEYNEVKNPQLIYHRGFAKSRMWSQYGENHKGMCLIFDKDKLISRIKKKYRKNSVYSGSVHYDNKLIELKKATVRTEEEKRISSEQIFSQNVKQYLFTKLEDYENEQEFKIGIYKNDFDQKEFVDIFFTDALIGIICGVNFPEAYLPIIKEYQKDISIYEMNSFNGDFEIKEVR